ncbi:MAG: type II toxin-antitoxin system prevent-host-death family antitoxin [Burkholderiales bacterium]|nr:type II toxin-antitoxin system prevent-host-death family antitoxin [Burkholderiales bacterium]
MALTVNVHEAKTQLSRLLEAAAKGEEVVIARNGEPVARLVPIARARRAPGAARGRGRLTPGFFEPLPDEWLNTLEGGR